ncbi:winged helix-turn-helix domain-containing protein [Tahibacter sp. UC22_41]|uniref:winged helix-turn-helix domain-containing protein n=1 Tax=Tahibacter sp. UC22_41 TaxID=3350178 RepID=UPI0036DC54C8
MTLPLLRFGAFELDPAARELRRDGERLELPSSAFDGLVYLIRHRDRAVGRDELMAAIWGRADVADSLLGQTLVRLRRTLGDSGDTQQWIRTVPRFGYRWIGAVEEGGGTASTIPMTATPAAGTVPAGAVVSAAPGATAATTAASVAATTPVPMAASPTTAASVVTVPAAVSPTATAPAAAALNAAAGTIAAIDAATAAAAMRTRGSTADPAMPTATSPASDDHSATTTIDSAVATTTPIGTPSAAIATGPASTAAPAADSAPPHPVPRRWPGIAASAAVLVAAVLLYLALAARHQPAEPGTTAAPPASARAPATSAPALVLPAQVDAGEEWTWLRLGLMDLVANRLRRGELATASSESVVALLRERDTRDPAALLDSRDLAAADTLRILPEVSRRDGRWQVRLRARDATRHVDVETRADDAMSAAREAADTLLLRLGRLPPDDREDTPQDLAELLQRTRAAMLADQLDLAGELIRRADPALRARPEITLRLAQIELRAGDYFAVERRLLQLLDELPAARDPELRGRALVTLAASYIRRTRPEDALRHYDEAITLLRGRKAPDALGLALLGRGLVATLRDDYDAALADLGLARAETEAAGNELGTGQVDLNLGLIEVRRLRPATALPGLTDAAARFERLGAQEEFVFTLASIAEVQQLLLDHAGALATTLRYWPPETHSRNQRLRHKLREVRAEALLETGQLQAAMPLLDTVLAEAEADLDAATIARVHLAKARIAAARGQSAAVAEQAALARVKALADNDPIRYVQAWRLRLQGLRGQGELAAAARETAELQTWVQAHADPWREAQASLAQAEQQAAEGDTDAALALFERTLHQFDLAGAIPDDLVEVIQPYTALLVRNGRLDAAHALSARIAPWADHDLRAASVFVRLNTALGRSDTRAAAERRARELAGERQLP